MAQMNPGTEQPTPKNRAGTIRVAVAQMSGAASRSMPRVEEIVRCAVQAEASLVALPLQIEDLDQEAVFLSGMARLAASYAVVLVPGSYLEEATDDHGQVVVYRTAPVFGLDGQCLGQVRQTHRSDQDRARGLAVANRLPVINTGAGRLGLVIGEDIRYPEVSRILALQGADIFIYLPSGRVDFQEEAWLAGLWREVQANQTFGLESWPVDPGLGWRGRSAIHAPCEMTPDSSGLLAQAPTVDGEHFLVADLDFAARQGVLENYPIFHYFNLDLYRRELVQAYEQAD